MSLAALAVGISSSPSEAPPPRSPQIISVFPAGAQRGSKVQVQVQGKALEGVYGVWLSTESVGGRIDRVEPIELEELPGTGPRREKKKYAAQRAWLTLQVDAAARSGRHWVRLVSPRGVSNALPF